MSHRLKAPTKDFHVLLGNRLPGVGLCSADITHQKAFLVGYLNRLSDIERQMGR